MFVHVYFGFPETRGRRLEEIAQIWDENIPAWKSKNWQPTIPLLSDGQLESKLAATHVEQADEEKAVFSNTSSDNV